MRCKNEYCPQRMSCQLRNPAEEQAGPAPCAAFYRRRDGIGVLLISGGIHGDVGPVCQEMRQAEMSGLVISLDTHGGNGGTTEALCAVIKDVGQRVKTVAVVSTMAASAGLDIALSCSEVVCAPGSRFGGLGVMYHICNGNIPMLIISEKSTEKDISSAGPSYWDYDAKIIDALQRFADNEVKEKLTMISENRNISQELVEDLLGTGRTVSAEELLQAGIIDGINTMKAVIGRLRSK